MCQLSFLRDTRVPWEILGACGSHMFLAPKSKINPVGPAFVQPSFNTTCFLLAYDMHIVDAMFHI
jgi:hypothetical protein